MSNFHEQRVPDDLQHVVEHLRDQRPEPTPLELDRIKLRAMARAKGAATLTPIGKGRFMRSRLISVMLAVGVLAGGTGAMAVTGAGGVFRTGPSPNANPRSQYCPPKSQHPGKPKKPRPARCGLGPKPH
jgi:hypothetical protein